MKSFHKPPRGAKNRARLPSTEPEAPPAEPAVPPLPEGPLDLKNPEHMRRWLQAMSEVVSDLVCIAREGTRRLKHRVLSRAEMRRQMKEAEGSANGLLARAEEALLR